MPITTPHSHGLIRHAPGDWIMPAQGKQSIFGTTIELSDAGGADHGVVCVNEGEVTVPKSTIPKADDGTASGEV